MKIKIIDFSKYEFKPKEQLFRFAMVPLRLRNWHDCETGKVKEFIEYCKGSGMSVDVNDWYELKLKDAKINDGK